MYSTWITVCVFVCVSQTLETENSYYMAMELCAGGDLMDRICERKRLEEREVRRYTRQILSAVEHLHKHGIVHRWDHTHWRLYETFNKESRADQLIDLSCITDRHWKLLDRLKKNIYFFSNQFQNSCVNLIKSNHTLCILCILNNQVITFQFREAFKLTFVTLGWS